jgi:hypothetical protein
MENNDKTNDHKSELEAKQPVEHDYEAHKESPAPAKEAVLEENDKGGGPVLKWILPAIVVVLIILWMVVK